MGYDNDGHDNVVWNYLNGWFAYSVENNVVIEELEKDRKQLVIPMPSYISCL